VHPQPEQQVGGGAPANTDNVTGTKGWSNFNFSPSMNVEKLKSALSLLDSGVLVEESAVTPLLILLGGLCFLVYFFLRFL
jgi:hypothetical protein